MATTEKWIPLKNLDPPEIEQSFHDFSSFIAVEKNVPKYENSLLISNSTSVSYQKVYRQTAFLWLWVLLKSLPKKDVITGGWEKFHFLSWDPSTFEFGARNGQPLKSPLFHVSTWFCWLHIPFHFPFLPDNTGWNKAQLVVKGKKLMFLAKFWRFMLS